MRSAKLGNHLKSILLPELLRILFWTCIGALAVSLLALIIAGVYFRHKLVHGSQKPGRTLSGMGSLNIMIRLYSIDKTDIKSKT